MNQSDNFIGIQWIDGNRPITDMVRLDAARRFFNDLRNGVPDAISMSPGMRYCIDLYLSEYGIPEGLPSLSDLTVVIFETETVGYTFHNNPKP